MTSERDQARKDREEVARELAEITASVMQLVDTLVDGVITKQEARSSEGTYFDGFTDACLDVKTAVQKALDNS